jgi:hypothetical protein
MIFRYREHLVLPVTFRDAAMNDWSASAHIEFTDNVTVHTVVLKCSKTFETEQQAEQYITQRAKMWVDDRLIAVSGTASRHAFAKTATVQITR